MINGVTKATADQCGISRKPTTVTITTHETVVKINLDVLEARNDQAASS